LFLFTSYYEGFGLPVLEAMQSGIPVITSNTSSLPEIVGDNGIMHDPDDVKGFADSITSLLRDEQSYNEYCSKSLKGASKFDVMESIKQHVELFQHVHLQN
jgi:glycosyltransferase involved in cell wall biosynthesis